MRNFITIVLSILSLTIICSGYAFAETGWDKEGLKGKVKEVREYGMKKPGGIKKKGSLLNSRSFDAKGNKVEQCYYYDDDSLNYKDVYKYDSNNNMIEECWYMADSSLSEKTTIKYDENNNKIEKISCLHDGSLLSKDTFKYDSNNNVVENAIYISDGSLISKRLYKYDSHNNCIEIKNVTYGNGSIIEYEYYK